MRGCYFGNEKLNRVLRPDGHPWGYGCGDAKTDI